MVLPEPLRTFVAVGVANGGDPSQGVALPPKGSPADLVAHGKAVVSPTGAIAMGGGLGWKSDGRLGVLSTKDLYGPQRSGWKGVVSDLLNDGPLCNPGYPCENQKYLPTLAIVPAGGGDLVSRNAPKPRFEIDSLGTTNDLEGPQAQIRINKLAGDGFAADVAAYLRGRGRTVVTDREDKAALTFKTPNGPRTFDLGVWDKSGNLLGYIEAKRGNLRIVQRKRRRMSGCINSTGSVLL
jgi:hypothetical protein